MNSAEDTPEDTVDVWRIELGATPEKVEALREVLDPDELLRSEGLLFPEDRRRYVVSHGMVRLILGERMSVPPERLRWTRGPTGKPALAGPGELPQCNLSHSGELALLAVSARRQVGVDLERIRTERVATALAARWFPSAGPMSAGRFAVLWTRKEACVKVFGGRVVEILRLTITDEAARSGALARPPGGGPDRVCRVRDLPALPPEYRAAVALGDEGPYRIRWRNAP